MKILSFYLVPGFVVQGRVCFEGAAMAVALCDHQE
jgi:hypothetical protein